MPEAPFQTHVGSVSVGTSLLESPPLVEEEIPEHMIVEVLHPGRVREAQWDLGVRVGTLGTQGRGGPRPLAEGACPGGI